MVVLNIVLSMLKIKHTPPALYYQLYCGNIDCNPIIFTGAIKHERFMCNDMDAL